MVRCEQKKEVDAGVVVESLRSVLSTLCLIFEGFAS